MTDQEREMKQVARNFIEVSESLQAECRAAYNLCKDRIPEERIQALIERGLNIGEKRIEQMRKFIELTDNADEAVKEAREDYEFAKQSRDEFFYILRETLRMFGADDVIEQL